MTLSIGSPPSPHPDHLRVLCFGDVVGSAGRNALREHLPELRRRWQVHMVVANGENSAGGIGLTPATGKDLFQTGVDVLTSGNHIWRHKECLPYLEKETRLIRPANYPGSAPGRGFGIFTTNGCRVAVINLLGRIFMEPVDCPFQTIEAILPQIREEADVILVDFHAEATSEKRALAHFLDGRTACVFGTHTHVQTADAMILPHGTATITDLGMCGVEGSSVLGMAKEISIARLTTSIPRSFATAKGRGTMNGIMLDIDRATGKAVTINLIRHPSPPLLNYHRPAL